jgi:hypothetical protein
MTTINVKRNTDKAHLPKFLTKSAPCANLVAVEIVKNDLFNVVYDCQITIDIPEGFSGLILPKKGRLNKFLIMDIPTRSAYTGKNTFQISFKRTFLGVISRKKYKLNECIAEFFVFKNAEIKYVDVKSLDKPKRPRIDVK